MGITSSGIYEGWEAEALPLSLDGGSFLYFFILFLKSIRSCNILITSISSSEIR